jgi:glycosyltransferase involved in cell wall biosynthesis
VKSVERDGDVVVLSIVVPTRDRIVSLRRCLQALEQQSIGERVEVIVIDDASTDESQVAAIVARSQEATVVRHERRRGPAAARNSGVRASVGRFVCFTDDDCEPAPDWLERLQARLLAGADAVAGATVNARPSDALAEASQLVASSLVRGVPGEPGEILFAPSNNLACRRDLLVTVPFDESYPVAAGEDRDWCVRMRRAGFRLEYEPSAVVRHHHDLDLHAFWRQHRRYGAAARSFRAAHAADARVGFSFYPRLVGAGFRRGPLVGLAILLAQVATVVGYVRGRA